MTYMPLLLAIDDAIHAPDDAPMREAIALSPRPHAERCRCPSCEGQTPSVTVDARGHDCAVLSEDGRYRYVLTRYLKEWIRRDEPLFVYLMTNPSTANGHEDDPTIRRCKAFAAREGYAGLVVVNLYALRSRGPKALRAARDPVGPLGDVAIRVVGRVAAARGWPVVAAYGTGYRHRGADVLGALARLGARVRCLGTTQDGSPRHPLYVRGDAPLVPYEPPA